jgi:signal transduction histidine kinase
MNDVDTEVDSGRVPNGVAASKHVAYAYAATGLILTVAYFTATGSSVNARAAIYQVMAVAAGAAVLAGIWLNKPSNRRPWFLFAGGLLLWGSGDAYWNAYQWFLAKAAPYPSPADGLYLAAYPLLAAGVLTLMRGWGRAQLRDILDGTIVSVSAAVLVWVLLIGPLTRGSTLSAFGTVASIGTNVGDILVLAAFAQLIMSRRRKTNLALGGIGVSIALALVSDYVYAYLNLSSGYTSGMLVDAGWLLSYTLFGAAALHPSMRTIGALPAAVPTLSRLRIGTLVVALLSSPLALIVGSAASTPRATLEIGIGTTITVLLVGWRVWMLSQEREQVQAELASQNDQLLALARMKDEFLASVSHELRTPLTSIRGYAELLQEDGLPAEQRDYLDVIDRNAARLASLVEDLLLMAQIQSGALPLELDEVVLNELIERSTEAAKPFAASKHITLDIDTAPGIVAAQADAARLAQVLDNLVSNAIKYTHNGGSVSIGMTRTDDAAMITVSDNGIGIPQDEQTQMFGRFFRTSNARQSGAAGSGLGLAITRGIVEAHGGTIGFDSIEGEGSTFHLTLPLSGDVSLASAA